MFGLSTTGGQTGLPPSWRRGLAALGALGLMGALTLAGAVQAAPALPLTLSDDEAKALLEHVQAAARDADYSGIVVYQQGQALQSSLLAHIMDGTGERERMYALDGEPREYLRHNDEVSYILPQRKLVKQETGKSGRFPSLLQGEAAKLLQHYVVRVDDTGLARIAGRPCQVAYIEPKDNYRYAHRVCIDQATGLLLKAQIIGQDGQVLEQYAFAALDTGADVDPARLRGGSAEPDWEVQESHMAPADLASQGWRITPPPGFVPVMQVQRNLNHRETVSQLVLSDGLAAFSVFIEPLQSSQRTGRPVREQAQRGATHIHGVRIADYWLTAVGEVPADALAHVVDAVEYVPGAPQ
ncbi:MucB/RseB C-terminal domain-containing protein [Pseudomonas sp. S 311-6]|uniref:MucB/RseB-like sigma(E) regulatory protein n=1 Tax=Kerstersia gyiorum TaxID=206506 RepID=A0A4Q7N285_9BURK|nr:MucB/RseB C-terminal domain-containing protein [Kerstersia gyiorum]KAB0541943.1 siderophore-interacting protein [Kerstersia gyiorum]MCO7635497.1 MucB/RseB C-terminal domain-containing protein [Pseudomonas sp. S 311-6]QBR41563.1 siderophore-interacting protein [Kerstersia gyiorum]RZS73779.1 MucB/RseB-like sigma(E) regulatory protein [Kerstersia gyiorum]